MRTHKAFLALSLIALTAGLVACGSDDDDGGNPVAQQPYGPFVSDQYANGRNWLCHPLADRNYCDEDLSATVVYPDGSTEIEAHVKAENPAIDCFYVYPTWSLDNTGNSDLDAQEDQEGFVVKNQAARLNSVCRLFAPIYRQVTVAGLFQPDLQPDSALAQQDVTDSFKHYIANDNGGRGFVLIGHSQGAGRLRALIQSEVEPNPYLSDRMVSAILLGSTVAVPEGSDTGGSFDLFPPCRDTGDVGCIISYVSYRSTAPAKPGDIFGNAGEGTRALCTNPVGLADSPEFSTPYFPTDAGGLILTGGPVQGPFENRERLAEITTPFYTMPDFIRLGCATTPGYDFLEVTIVPNPSDPRADDISGTLEGVLPGWGLHIVDANVAMGDLVDLVELQAETWTR